MSQYRAVVVDDHPLVARGIGEYLKTHCGFVSVQVIADGENCLRNLREEGCPDLVVIDFWLREGPAISLTKTLLTQFRNVKILALSGDDDARIVQTVRAAGCQGFVGKNEPPEVFARAVTALMSGETAFSFPPRIGSEQTHKRGLPVSSGELGLTKRQGEVLALVLRGLPNKRIAAALKLSEATVKEHITGILQKLGVSNRIDVVRLLSGRRLED